uniref:Uncharacterized protein n=1 Tax=Macaca fascicularis TaxID=9541 RepID=A0A7N9D3T2_MACFA
CWRGDAGLFVITNYLTCANFCLYQINSSRVHVHNLQVCYICVYVPCWCAAPINSSSPINSAFITT